MLSLQMASPLNAPVRFELSQLSAQTRCCMGVCGGGVVGGAVAVGTWQHDNNRTRVIHIIIWTIVCLRSITKKVPLVVTRARPW